MNIFVLDFNPEKAASLHCDRHVIKMILESAQMLCSSIHCHDKGRQVKYKPTHINHPCTIWARKSRDNFMWLVQLSKALVDEHLLRYPRSSKHKSASVIEECESLFHVIPRGYMTEFAQAMPNEYKKECPVEAYQEFYRKDKVRFATWKSPRSTPQFMFE
jgi:hypothetical protein